MTDKKTVDLNSLIAIFKKLDSVSAKMFLNIHNCQIRETEVQQINSLVNNFKKSQTRLSNFYVGYKIPQIPKEFDLLRFGSDSIINIELKSDFNVDKIKKQLLENRYYLSLLGCPIYSYTYSEETNFLYKLDDEDQLIDVDYLELEELILSQKIVDIPNIDLLFNPKNYLVSPFNNHEKFIKGEYFLTEQQDGYKKSFITKSPQFTIIDGNPGTGKTLLLYDLAKTMIGSGNDVLIIHCGILNQGHEQLKVNQKWNIIPPKEVSLIEIYQPSIIFVDETQRFYPHQLKHVIDYVNENNIRAVFSIDPKQILSVEERNHNNYNELISLPDNLFIKLTSKIRSNIELRSFIKGFFNVNYLHQCQNLDNISINYFDDISQARNYAITMKENDWTIIDYTQQRYNGEHIDEMCLDIGLNTHNVLGQEFDKVLVVIGPAFYYDESGSLSTKVANHFDPERMIYQSITRTRQKLSIVIVNNPEFLNTILSSLNHRITLK